MKSGEVLRLTLKNINSQSFQKQLFYNFRLPMRCKFSGCEEVQIFSRLSDHEKICDYRPVNCVYISCNEKVALANLMNHLSTKHGSLQVISRPEMCSGSLTSDEYSKATIKIEKEKFGKDYILLFKPILYKCEDFNFFLECQRHTDKLWYIWLYFLGPQEYADKFKYVLHLSHKDEVSSIKHQILKD